MKFFIVLALLVQTVICRVAYNLEGDISNEGLSADTIEEIQHYIELTKNFDESHPPQHILRELITIREEDICFYVYNQDDPNGRKISTLEARNIAQLTAFDTNLDTVIGVHGWQNKYDSLFNTLIEQAFLEKKNINVISVDWDRFASSYSYLYAYNAVPLVGRLVGEFIGNISEAYKYPLDRISMIGHSLGAHICGYAGQYTNGSLSSIIGLDPAGPFYFKPYPHSRLSVGDAQYVEAIHTDASFLGLSYAIGDVDYWPNGGYIQPGCGVSLGMCSHSRAYLLFQESLSSNGFVSVKCDSFSHYKAGRCKDNEVACMGPTVNKTVTGNYYLTTNPTAPYALG